MTLYLSHLDGLEACPEWPGEGAGFCLVIALDEKERSPAERYWALARGALGAGVRTVLCAGQAAALLEDAFLDEIAELPDGPDEDVVLTSCAPGMPLDEALWTSWHVPEIEDGSVRASVPVVVCLFGEDRRVDELRLLAADLAGTFGRVLAREP